MIRWLKERYSSYDWSLLSTLAPSRWKPNAGWTTGAPSYLPAVVASRQLRAPLQPLQRRRRARGRCPASPSTAPRSPTCSTGPTRWGAAGSSYGLAGFKDITFPALSDRQKQVAKFALKWIGYPYVWAGEYPTPDSPYGTQKSGGFDCSGFVFYVMKMHFDYPITVNERGAHDMAARAKPRITRDKLKCGDLIFFGPKGPSSSVESIYHTGLYLGRGWFIHSTGSSDGVTLASLNNSSYWKAAFAWGRRMLTPAELLLPTPSPTASAAPAAAPAPESSATPTPGACGLALRRRHAGSRIACAGTALTFTPPGVQPRALVAAGGRRVRPECRAAGARVVDFRPAAIDRGGPP